MLHNLRHEPLPRKLKITRPEKRKRVTLIAAFRCNTYGAPGVVICADSQETVGEYRVSVDKIAPRVLGDYQMVIGGAGNAAGLIDDFIENFSRIVESWPAGLSEQ